MQTNSEVLSEFILLTSGQLLSADNEVMSQADFLSLHSLSDLLSDHGICPFRNSDIKTRPWKIEKSELRDK